MVDPGFESHEAEAYVSVTSYSCWCPCYSSELATLGDIVPLDNPGQSEPHPSYPRYKDSLTHTY